MTCGKARGGLVAASGRVGSDAEGTTPAGRVAGGRVPGGRVAPTPAGVGVPLVEDAVGVGVGVAGVCTETLSHPEAGDPASSDVPVPMRVTLLGEDFCGTVTLATSSVAWPLARLTPQVAVPACGQTVKTAGSMAGCVVRVTVASPVVVPANQTQTAKLASAPGSTAIPDGMAWTCTHNWPVGAEDEADGLGDVDGPLLLGLGEVEAGGVVDGVFEGLVATVRFKLQGLMVGVVGLVRSMPAMPDDTSASPPRAPNP